MGAYRLDMNNNSEGVILWMETPCGTKPVMGWHDLDGMRGFAEMLLDYYWNQKIKEPERIETAEDILQQALGQDG